MKKYYKLIIVFTVIVLLCLFATKILFLKKGTNLFEMNKFNVNNVGIIDSENTDIEDKDETEDVIKNETADITSDDEEKNEVVIDLKNISTISNLQTTKIKKKAYITIDDGPGKYTKKYLELFDKYNIKVTYFCTYDNEYRRKRVKEVYEHGHTLGCHSYKHKPEIIYVSEDVFFDDITKEINLIEEETGVKTKYIRFPFGSGNVSSKFNPGIMTRLTKLLKEKGYKYFDWNVYGEDITKSSIEMYNTCVNQLSELGAKESAIILCHDSHIEFLEYIEMLILYLIENDYDILPITDDTQVCHHKLLN